MPGRIEFSSDDGWSVQHSRSSARKKKLQSPVTPETTQVYKKKEGCWVEIKPGLRVREGSIVFVKISDNAGLETGNTSDPSPGTVPSRIAAILKIHEEIPGRPTHITCVPCTQKPPNMLDSIPLKDVVRKSCYMRLSDIKYLPLDAVIRTDYRLVPVEVYMEVMKYYQEVLKATPCLFTMKFDGNDHQDFLVYRRYASTSAGQSALAIPVHTNKISNVYFRKNGMFAYAHPNMLMGLDIKAREAVMGRSIPDLKVSFDSDKAKAVTDAFEE